MSGAVFLIVVFAALMHATWNAMVKNSGDRFIMFGVMNVGTFLAGLVVVSFTPLPAPESWPFLVASTLVHMFYYVALTRSYQLGDFSLVYPIARGVAPLLVGLGGALFAKEYLDFYQWLGIVAVSFGIFLLSFRSLMRVENFTPVLAALITGTSIGCYSVIDGLGVRAAETALGYIAWLMILEGIFVVGYVGIKKRGELKHIEGRAIVLGLLGGLISMLAYGLVLYAKTLSPLGLVSALRETSVIFAALIGVIVFRERPWQWRVLAASVVAVGVILMALI